MDRRTLLKIGGMGLIGSGLGACSVRSAPPGQPLLRSRSMPRVPDTTAG